MIGSVIIAAVFLLDSQTPPDDSLGMTEITGSERPGCVH